MMVVLAKIATYEKLTIALCTGMLALLLLVSRSHQIGGYGVETDFYGSYAVEAFHLLNGQGYEEPDHGPGYSLTLIPFYWLLEDMFLAGKVLTIFSAVGLGFVTFKVFEQLFNARLAFFTVVLLFVIVFPYSYLASNDVFFAFLTMLCVYLFFRTGVITLSNLLFSGLIAGFAFMTRMNAAILPAAVFSSILFLNPEKWSWTQRLKGLSLFSAAFLIVTSPWLIMNYVKHGNPMATEVYQTIGAGMQATNNSGSAAGGIAWREEKNAVAQKHHSLITVLLADPLHTLKFFFGNVVNHLQRLLMALIKFPAYLFLLPGGILLLSQANRKQLALFTFPLFGYLIYCILAFIDRYFLYIIAFLLLMVVYFLFQTDWLLKNERSARMFRLINKLAFAGTLILLSLNSAKAIQKELAADPVELIKISEVVKKHVTEGETLIARKPHLGFISCVKVVYFPEVESVAALVDYARQKNARLLLYSPIEVAYRPKLSQLLEPDKLGPELSLIFHQQNPEIFLYKINQNQEDPSQWVPLINL
jgi:hypothetical protein